MNKTLKIFLILSLTLLVSAAAFFAIRATILEPEANPALTLEVPKERPGKPFVGAPSPDHPLRQTDSLLQEIMEREMFEQLERRSRESGLSSPPPEVDPEALKTSTPFSHVPLDRFEKNATRRRLEDANTLPEPGIIAFDKQANSTQKYYAYQYIFRNLREYSTQFVLYPYSFNYVPDPADHSQDVAYNKGAVFTLKPGLLPTDPNAYNYFTSFKAATDVQFGKAKALYDINVAILSVQDFYADIYMDLLYESTSYCNILSSYLGKYSDCIQGTSAYYAFKNDTKNAGKTALVMVGPEDITTHNLLFTPDGAPRFQILIVADHYTGAYSAINAKLGTAAIKKIKDYVNAGGLIYATGKSGYLLELWGIVTAGLYKTDTMLASTDTNLHERLTGCDTTKDDFWSALLCMNVAVGSSYGHSFLLSAYMMDQSKAVEYTTVMSYDASSTTLKKKDLTGHTHDLLLPDKQFLPFTLLGGYGKGNVILVNGNPLFKSWYNEIFYNAIMMAMSKNVVFDAYIGTKDNKPIPGGEAGILLDVMLSFINLYDKPVNNMNVHLWFPNGVVPTSIPETCIADPTDPPFFVNLTYVNKSSHMKCGQAVVAGFNKYNAVVNVEILDQSVTQPKYSILIVAPGIEYTESDTGVTYHYDLGGLRTDAVLGALLRGALNPDPSAFYPILGRGQYVDNVLQVENKEETKADNVEYIGMVPLISPVVDGSDQTAVITAVRFLPNYYKNDLRTYYYPFEDVASKNFDYLDFKWLNEKNIILGAEWEIPVKPIKITRPADFPEVSETGPFDIGNLNYTTMINSKDTVLQQNYYINSDKFFEHAAQRLMVYVDTSKEKGAATRYPDGIPESERNPRKPTVAKKELIWTRSDVYFYQAQDYQKPANIDYTHVISLDRYPAYVGPCVEKFGAARAKIMVQGFFTVAEPEGLKPNEYSNELLMHCGKQKVELDQVETVSGGSIKPIHYLVPVTDPEIQQADDIMYFINNGDGTGYLKDYPELKFIYAHYVNMLVDGSITRQGGKIEILFDSSVGFKNEDTEDPIAKGWMTYSADQVAFYKTTYDKVTKKVTAYFKRGLMPNEAYGKASLLGLMVEQLNVNVDTPVTIKIYEMKYDISLKEENYERYMLREERSLTLKYDRFYSLPAVEVHVKMNRNNDASMLGYELLEAFSRFGVYIQELQKHRTVYASTEIHNPRDPGVVAANGGFAMISNLGISSVPFAEYVMTGKALLIPSSPTTSRLEWDDIWGRRWSQPLRSVFPDIPPIPPPLKNFIMTTTFELTKAGATDRVLSWTSDEELDIRVQLKLLNNYPKYFEITTCNNNNVTYFQTRECMFEKLRIFDIPNPKYDFEISSAEAPTDRYHINFGHKSTYGMCFDEDGTVLEGVNVTETQRNQIATAYLCANDPDPAKVITCAAQLSGLPTVKHKPDEFHGQIWMYSPKVERYYPKNYIKSSMWNLTHYDYDDNPMDKAYKYHMDNNLPGMDYGPPQNPARLQPHNLIAQPIFKGFGYKITYDKTKTLARFPKYKGWWSDNLQNKDHTLVAGQEMSNDVSVDKETLLPADKWINARDLINPETRAVIESRLRNIHTCLFNQHRVKLSPNQQRYAYLGNVYQNNIIPIIPDLEKNDPRLTSYDCSNVQQYTPETISQVDNVVATPTVRDWLYFGANLRGGALENINVPYSMAPIPGVKIEGLVKVQDGGRFVYWNPANGPNSFLIVDNPVNVVEATRCDLAITEEVFPKSTTTFKPELYHLMTISDPAEINREWKYETYTNNYGFGDAAVAIFVGGIQATTATIGPGQTTFVKVTFYNNAGFDWNMLARAIDFQIVGSQPISANDLLFRLVHSIQKPLAYNFMILNIPDEIKPYIDIVPSDHNIDVAPQFFDFMNINVVQIRDGYKGDYYYKLSIKNDFPESLMGKVYEIKIDLNETCFDKLPGYNDPTGNYHDYKLKIPSIKFGIPYAASSPYAGKVFYTSGYSHDLEIRASVPKYWIFEEARFITDEQISKLRQAAGDTEFYTRELQKVWDELDTTTAIQVTNTTSDGDTTIKVNLANAFPTFPAKKANGPDAASFSVLFKTTTAQIPYGTVRVMSSPRILYKDFVNKQKSEVIPEPLDKTVTSSGAWLQITYNSKLVVKLDGGSYVDSPDQRIFTQDGTALARVNITTQNVGNAPAYRVNFTLTLAEGVSIIPEMMPKGMNYFTEASGTDTIVKLVTGRTFGGGDFYAEAIYVKVTKISRRRLLATTTGSKYLTIIKSVSADIDLTQDQGAVQVSQAISTPLKFSVITSDRDTVGVSVATDFDNNLPVFHITATASPAIVNGNNVRYEIMRRMVQLDCDNDPASPATGTCSSVMNPNWVTVKAISEINTADDRPIPSTFTGVIRSGSFDYMVTTYDNKKQQLATTTWHAVAQRPNPTPAPQPKPQPEPTPTPQPEPINNGTNGDPVKPDDPGTENNNGTNSTEEAKAEAGEEYKLPLYAIILIPTCAFAVILVAAILIYRKYRLVKVVPEGSSQEVVKVVEPVSNFDV